MVPANVEPVMCEAASIKNYQEIPIIDLGPFFNGVPGGAEKTADRLRWVQEEVGFYYLINHGISADLIKNSLEQVRLFHSLPLEEKLNLKVDERSTGYVPIRSTVYVSSNVNKNTKRDLNANFRIVRERPIDHPSIITGRRFTGPNKWPNTSLLPDFKRVMLEYYSAMEDLGNSLLPLYALALDLKPDYFDDLFTDPTWLTRNVHYPPESPEDNQFGISPHTDHGFITLIPISEVLGLEVQSPDHGWIPAKYVENGLIVNSGDFMAKWTNGRFIATPHRVLAPAKDRYISAFFYNPNWNVTSEPLPSCTGPDNPPKFKTSTFLDHLCNYVDRNYTQSSGGTMANNAFS